VRRREDLLTSLFQIQQGFTHSGQYDRVQRSRGRGYPWLWRVNLLRAAASGLQFFFEPGERLLGLADFVGKFIPARYLRRRGVRPLLLGRLADNGGDAAIQRL